MGGLVSVLNAVFRRAFTSAGLRSNTVSIADGTTVRFWAPPSLLPAVSNDKKNPTISTANKPVLVLIHGFGPDATWQWAAQIGMLSRHFNIIVPDLLFFGGSCTSSPLRSDTFQASTIADLLAALGVKDKVSAIVGTSYGGMVAYQLAKQLEEEKQLAKVVICDADLMKLPEDDKELAARGGVEVVMDLMLPTDSKKMRQLMALGVHSPPKFVPECLVRDLLKSFGPNREEKVDLIKGITTDEPTPLPQDVLIIWGEHDQIFPLDKGRKVREKLGEKAILKVIPNTGHMPHQEDSKQFNEILLNFLVDGSKY